jgi:hypothetical protein
MSSDVGSVPRRDVGARRSRRGRSCTGCTRATHFRGTGFRAGRSGLQTRRRDRAHGQRPPVLSARRGPTRSPTRQGRTASRAPCRRCGAFPRTSSPRGPRPGAARALDRGLRVVDAVPRLATRYYRAVLLRGARHLSDEPRCELVYGKRLGARRSAWQSVGPLPFGGSPPRPLSAARSGTHASRRARTSRCVARIRCHAHCRERERCCTCECREHAAAIDNAPREPARCPACDA